LRKPGPARTSRGRWWESLRVGSGDRTGPRRAPRPRRCAGGGAPREPRWGSRPTREIVG